MQPKHCNSTNKTNPKFQSSIQKLRIKPSASSPTTPGATHLLNDSTTKKPPNFATLPTVVLTKIYSLLAFRDCLQASACCKHWRLTLIHSSPSLWSHQFPPLSIYLCNERDDLSSANFKLANFSNIASDLLFKFDANSPALIRRLAFMLSTGHFNNLKRLSLQPILQSYCEHDTFYENPLETSELELNKIKILNSVSNIILSAKSIDHISLGFITTNSNHSTLLNDLSKLNIISALVKKHANNLRSLHMSTCWTGPNANHNNALSQVAYVNGGSGSFVGKHSKGDFQCAIHLELGSLLSSFGRLQGLSVDFGDLSEGLIRSELFATSLKILNLNVNKIPTFTESQRQERNTAWQECVDKNTNLRVTVNFLATEEAARKYRDVLSYAMPVQTMRMFFCKSFTSSLIQYVSNNYSETLLKLYVLDQVVEPTLRYHNPLRQDADPDPLVLLCWKCKRMEELMVIGYEVLEINLVAIAKLRIGLKVFGVAMDCVIDLKYGLFRSDDDFIEDEDGDDTIVDYGSCSEHIIEKVSKILNHPNWHPLEKDELPLCIYEANAPFEEAYLETLIADQLNADKPVQE